MQAPVSRFSCRLTSRERKRIRPRPSALARTYPPLLSKIDPDSLI
jgi:hypothetical protein